jgi:hypothetical protein
VYLCNGLILYELLGGFLARLGLFIISWIVLYCIEKPKCTFM